MSEIVDQNSKLNWTINDNSAIYVEYFVNYCQNVSNATALKESFSFRLADLNGLFYMIQ